MAEGFDWHDCLWTGIVFVKEKDPETLARFEGDQVVRMLQREQEGIDEVVKKIQEKLEK